LPQDYSIPCCARHKRLAKKEGRPYIDLWASDAVTNGSASEKPQRLVLVQV